MPANKLLFLVVISCCTYILELVILVYLLCVVSNGSEKIGISLKYGLLCSLTLGVFIVTVVSSIMVYTIWRNRQIEVKGAAVTVVVLAHLIQLSLLLRYVYLLTAIVNEKIKMSRKEMWQLNILRLTHTLVVSLPSLLTICICTFDNLTNQYGNKSRDFQIQLLIIFAVCLFSASWSIATYKKFNCGDGYCCVAGSYPSLRALCLLIPWRFGEILSRFLTLALFASCFNIWVLFILILRWLTMLLLCIFDYVILTSFHRDVDKCKIHSTSRIVFNFVVTSYALIFCQLNIFNGLQTTALIIYHVVVSAECAALLVIWVLVEQASKTWQVSIGVLSVVCYTISALTCLLYYGCYRSKVTSTLASSPRISTITQHPTIRIPQEQSGTLSDQCLECVNTCQKCKTKFSTINEQDGLEGFNNDSFRQSRSLQERGVRDWVVDSSISRYQEDQVRDSDNGVDFTWDDYDIEIDQHLPHFDNSPIDFDGPELFSPNELRNGCNDDLSHAGIGAFPFPISISTPRYENVNNVLVKKNIITMAKEKLDTPRKNADTPRNHEDTPRNQVDTPRNQEDTSRNQVDTPRNKLNTPRIKLDTPRNKQDTPRNKQCTPRNKLDTPRNKQDTPRNKQDTPRNKQDTPRNNQDTPRNNHDTPRNKLDTPRKQVDSPRNLNSNGDTPRTDILYPRNTISTPVDNKAISTNNVTQPTNTQITNKICRDDLKLDLRSLHDDFDGDFDGDSADTGGETGLQDPVDDGGRVGVLVNHDRILSARQLKRDHEMKNEEKRISVSAREFKKLRENDNELYMDDNLRNCYDLSWSQLRLANDFVNDIDEERLRRTASMKRRSNSYDAAIEAKPNCTKSNHFNHVDGSGGGGCGDSCGDCGSGGDGGKGVDGYGILGDCVNIKIHDNSTDCNNDSRNIKVYDSAMKKERTGSDFVNKNVPSIKSNIQEDLRKSPIASKIPVYSKVERIRRVVINDEITEDASRITSKDKSNRVNGVKIMKTGLEVDMSALRSQHDDKMSIYYLKKKEKSRRPIDVYHERALQMRKERNEMRKKIKDIQNQNMITNELL